MAKGKLKRSYKDVDRDREAGYAGEEPPRGIYDGELIRVSEHPTSNSPDGVEWVFRLTEEPYAGWQGWQYSNGDSTSWKEVQILEAAGIIAHEDEEIDMTFEQIVKKANPVRLKLSVEKSEEYGTRAKIRTVLPMPDGKASTGGAKKKKSKKAKGKDEPPF